jgi:hypothetical protein
LENQDNNITRASIELGGIRTVLNVPMVKENVLVGAFLSRQEVHPFTDKQIARHELRRSSGNRYRKRAAAQRADKRRYNCGGIDQTPYAAVDREGVW